MADFGAGFVSMEERMFVRVKLDLRCAVPHQGMRDLVWIVVDRSKLETIEQFILLVRSQYGLPKEIELYIDGALLPHGEPTVILKDGDTVRVVRPVKQQSLNSGSQSANHPELSQAADVEGPPGSSDGAEVDSVIAADNDDTSSQVAYLPIKQEVEDPPESSDGVEADSVIAVDNDDTSSQVADLPIKQEVEDPPESRYGVEVDSVIAVDNDDTSSQVADLPIKQDVEDPPGSSNGAEVENVIAVDDDDTSSQVAHLPIKQDVEDPPESSNGVEVDSVIAVDDDDTLSQVADLPIKQEVEDPSESSDGIEVDSVISVDANDTLETTWRDHFSESTIDEDSTPCFLAVRSTAALIDEPASSTSQNSSPASTPGRVIAMPDSMQCHDKRQLRSIGVIKQQSSSDSQGDNSPEPLPATDQPIKDAVWVPLESRDGAKVDRKPAVEVGDVVDRPWKDHSYTSKSTTDQSATPCFPAPQSTVNGGPASSTSVHPKTMGTSVATLNSFLRGMWSRGKKRRRRRRPTKKEYVDKCTQTLESPTFRPLASAGSPVQLGRQHCLGGNKPGDLQNNAQSAPARKLPCIVYVSKSAKRAREQESPQAGKSGEDQQVPAKASRYSSAPRPPDIAMPEAES